MKQAALKICHYFYTLEKAMAPHSSTLAWKIPWTEEPGGLQSMGSLRVNTTERLQFHFPLSCTGEGNGNPLQCSCLENPRDGAAWWAAVYGVAESRTRLKRLSSSSSTPTFTPYTINNTTVRRFIIISLPPQTNFDQRSFVLVGLVNQMLLYLIRR